MITEGISGLRYRQLAALRLQMKGAPLSLHKIILTHIQTMPAMQTINRIILKTLLSLKYFHQRKQNNNKNNNNFTYVYIYMKYKVILFNITSTFEELWLTPEAEEKVLYLKIWVWLFQNVNLSDDCDDQCHCQKNI